MSTRGFLILLLVLAINAKPALARNIHQATYCNHRFEYCLDYLTNLLRALPEAPNGDGRIFMNNQGRECLRVYGTGSWNFNKESEPIDLKQLYQLELKGGRFPKKEQPRLVTYKAYHDKSFIISGTEGDEIFYMMVLQGRDAFCYAYLHYPKQQATTYKPLAEVLARTFRYIGN